MVKNLWKIRGRSDRFEALIISANVNLQMYLHTVTHHVHGGQNRSEVDSIRVREFQNECLETQANPDAHLD